MGRRGRVVIISAGIFFGVLALAGCFVFREVPNVPSPDPSFSEFDEGIWRVQTFGELTMLSLLEDPGIDGQVPSYGKLVFTDDGCLGFEQEDRTALLVFSPGAVLLSPEKFEFRGQSYELGDSVVISGEGVPEGSLPLSCVSDWTLRAASMELGPE